MLIYIIPTYKCNLSCKNCYSKKYLENFSNYLSWQNFISIYNRFKNYSKNFCFIGGEPTIWKFINEAILFLQNKNIYVSVFTNGVIPLNVIPSALIINGTNLFDKNIKDRIIKNILSYNKEDVKICIRYNIDERFNQTIIEKAVNYAKKFAHSVSISALYPIKNSINYGEMIYNLSYKLFKESIPIEISRALPLCLFTKKQRKFLISECKLKGKCSLPTGSLVINPDGKTIQPCIELKIYHNISEISKRQQKNIFMEEIDKFNKKLNPECENCFFYKKMKCFGGCLSYLSKSNFNVKPLKFNK